MTATTTCRISAANLADKTEDRIRSLLDDLASSNPTVRTKARTALACIGNPSVPHVVQLLSHGKPHVRWEAAKVLVAIADPISATALVNALDDDDGDVRWLAAEGVIALGRDGLYPYALAGGKKLGPILAPVLVVLRKSEPQVYIPLAAYDALLKLRKLE
jgi:HEAT repeat protein